MVFTCGECGAEFECGGYAPMAERFLMLHLKMSGHCQKWNPDSVTQKKLEEMFLESLTVEDVDLLRRAKVKV